MKKVTQNSLLRMQLISVLCSIFTVAPLVTLGQINYFIHGSIPQLTQGRMVYLTINEKKDSTLSAHGFFSFKGTATNAGIAKIAVDLSGVGNDYHSWIFYLNGGKLELFMSNILPNKQLNGQKLYLLNSPLQEQNCFVIKGDSVSEDYQNKLLLPVLNANNEISATRVAYKMAKAKNLADTSILNQQIKDAVGKCFDIPQKYITTHPNSVLCITAIKMLGKGKAGSPVSLADLERFFNNFPDEIKNSNEGNAYAKDLQQWKERQKPTTGIKN